jgi:hypothetical protein
MSTAALLKRFGTGSTRMLNRGILKPLLQQAKLAHGSPLALRIGAIGDKPGSLFDSPYKLGFAVAVDEGGEFKHCRVSFVGKETFARDG